MKRNKVTSCSIRNLTLLLVFINDLSPQLVHKKQIRNVLQLTFNGYAVCMCNVQCLMLIHLVTAFHLCKCSTFDVYGDKDEKSLSNFYRLKSTRWLSIDIFNVQ